MRRAVFGVVATGATALMVSIVAPAAQAAPSILVVLPNETTVTFTVAVNCTPGSDGVITEYNTLLTSVTNLANGGTAEGSSIVHCDGTTQYAGFTLGLGLPAQTGDTMQYTLTGPGAAQTTGSIVMS